MNMKIMYCTKNNHKAKMNLNKLYFKMLKMI